MKKLMLWIIALAALQGSALHGQNITGSWQGTLKAGPQELRIVIKISTTEADNLSAVLYSINQPSPAIPATTFTRNGSTMKMTIATINGSYEGRLSGDGNSINGTWTQGGPPLPLNLTRATPETAWTIPEPPPPPKPMAADADPAFEVAAIKPARPDARFAFGVNRGSGLFTTTSSLSSLLRFAYDLHPRQITHGPSWLESKMFDIKAKFDTAGVPSTAQLKTMVQKLLADRFQLTFHREKKELSVYAITIAKTGAKLTKGETDANLPNFGFGPGILNARNATMTEVAGVLQEAAALEQPVVDQTGFGSARYTLFLRWTPDASQSAGAGPGPLPSANKADEPPDLFAAIQQLGLKLESTKAPIDVLVIDRVELPSEN